MSHVVSKLLPGVERMLLPVVSRTLISEAVIGYSSLMRVMRVPVLALARSSSAPVSTTMTHARVVTSIFQEIIKDAILIHHHVRLREVGKLIIIVVVKILAVRQEGLPLTVGALNCHELFLSGGTLGIPVRLLVRQRLLFLLVNLVRGFGSSLNRSSKDIVKLRGLRLCLLLLFPPSLLFLRLLGWLSLHGARLLHLGYRFLLLLLLSLASLLSLLPRLLHLRLFILLLGRSWHAHHGLLLNHGMLLHWHLRSNLRLFLLLLLLASLLTPSLLLLLGLLLWLLLLHRLLPLHWLLLLLHGLLPLHRLLLRLHGLLHGRLRLLLSLPAPWIMRLLLRSDLWLLWNHSWLHRLEGVLTINEFGLPLIREAVLLTVVVLFVIVFFVIQFVDKVLLSLLSELLRSKRIHSG